MTRATPCDNFTGTQCQRLNEMVLPRCAVLGGRGTIVVRIMDACDVCSRPVSWSARSATCTLKCEPCSRTSSCCRCSDCESVLDRCRPYRARDARSRYVNVCAAVCLLLLVGGLSPRSMAAPYGASEMDTEFWENPCDYQGKPKLDYTPELAKEIANESRSVIAKVKKYQDDYANYTHSFNHYESLLSFWDTEEWFRNRSWAAEKDLLPKEKSINISVPEEKLEQLMESDEKLDELLPHMFKGLKLVVASWRKLPAVIFDSDRSNQTNLTQKLGETAHDIKFMLCRFYELMSARNLLDKTEKLDINEIPKFDSYNKDKEVVIVFRDCLYYIEYLGQVFDKMYEKHSTATS